MQGIPPSYAPPCPTGGLCNDGRNLPKLLCPLPNKFLDTSNPPQLRMGAMSSHCTFGAVTGRPAAAQRVAGPIPARSTVVSVMKRCIVKVENYRPANEHTDHLMVPMQLAPPMDTCNIKGVMKTRIQLELQVLIGEIKITSEHTVRTLMMEGYGPPLCEVDKSVFGHQPAYCQDGEAKMWPKMEHRDLERECARLQYGVKAPQCAVRSHSRTIRPHLDSYSPCIHVPGGARGAAAARRGGALTSGQVYECICTVTPPRVPRALSAITMRARSTAILEIAKSGQL
uniref:SFRICE_021551 n=1 Tax=Spodoptera frugiperda TaxID=7108 RepID=A0A2H1VXC9_SPOFR